MNGKAKTINVGMCSTPLCAVERTAKNGWIACYTFTTALHESRKFLEVPNLNKSLHLHLIHEEEMQAHN